MYLKDSDRKATMRLFWGLCGTAFASIAVAAVVMLLVSSCCAPKVVTKTETKIEYRDRIVTDTAVVEVPVEVEKVVTRDTVSHLENTFAKSDASVAGGFLSHSLESIPQYIRVPVEVHVTDTLIKEGVETIKYVEVGEKPSRWRSFKSSAFWWLLGVIALLSLVLCIRR